MHERCSISYAFSSERWFLWWYEAAVADYETKKQELEQLKVEIRAKERRYVDSETFMKSLESIAVPIDSFREELWLSLIDHSCVPEKGEKSIYFCLRNGNDIRIII